MMANDGNVGVLVLLGLLDTSRWGPTGALADDYERKLLNGVLGIQKPLHNGTMVYMSPLGKGVSRVQANWNEGMSKKA